MFSKPFEYLYLITVWDIYIPTSKNVRSAAAEFINTIYILWIFIKKCLNTGSG